MYFSFFLFDYISLKFINTITMLQFWRSVKWPIYVVSSIIIFIGFVDYGSGAEFHLKLLSYALLFSNTFVVIFHFSDKFSFSNTLFWLLLLFILVWLIVLFKLDIIDSQKEQALSLLFALLMTKKTIPIVMKIRNIYS